MSRRLQRSEQITLAQHLQELRSRLMVSGAVFLSFSVAAYFLRDHIITWLQKPLQDTLYFSSPGGGFNFVLKVSILTGLLASLPVLIYHCLKFVEPVLPRHEHIKVAKFLSASVSLLVLGVLFGYFVTLPAALHFLSQFGGDNIQAIIGVNEYLNFVMAYLLGFGLLFQIPLVMLIINRLRPLEPMSLARGYKGIIPSAFLMGAVLTPTPDPVNQSLMAGPIVIMYTIAIGLVFIVARRTRANRARSQAAIAPILIPADTISAAAEIDLGQSADTSVRPAKPIRPVMRDIRPA